MPESLKNVLLVMNATGLLVPPPSANPEEDDRAERQVALWAATHERVERFLPGFLDEIVPAPPPKSAPAVPAQGAAAPSGPSS